MKQFGKVIGFSNSDLSRIWIVVLLTMFGRLVVCFNAFFLINRVILNVSFDISHIYFFQIGGRTRRQEGEKRNYQNGI